MGERRKSMSEKPRAYTPEQVLSDDRMDAIEQAWAEADEQEKKRIILGLLTELVDSGILPGFTGEDVRESLQPTPTKGDTRERLTIDGSVLP
jgi:hypothetical protein